MRTGSNENVTNNLGVSESDGNLGKEFISALMGVENVTLDVGLFKSPIFQSFIPSGAYVDPKPEKGRPDPFADATQIKVDTNLNNINSPRDVSFGGQDLIGSVFIRVSNITKTTSTISITGISQDQVVSLILITKDGSIIPVDLTYKNNEYSGVATSLKSLTTYTARIQSPDIYSGLQAEFTTK